MSLDIRMELTKNPKAKPQDESKLGFGKIFTDHMFMMDYEEGKGWYDLRIVPYGPLAIDPASTVLHYGAEIFEGMKAYRRVDGSIAMFRPDENGKRMNNSAERLCLPEIDPDMWLEILDTLVKLEKDWVPHSEGTSLYIRPLLSEMIRIWECMPCIIRLSSAFFLLSEPIMPRASIPSRSRSNLTTCVRSAAAPATRNAAATTRPPFAPASVRKRRALRRSCGSTA